MQKLIITGVAGVLIAATAFSTKPSISQSPALSPTPTTEPSQPKTRRLTIAISVAAMADLKVSEGQTLQTGDTIAVSIMRLLRILRLSVYDGSRSPKP